MSGITFPQLLSPTPLHMKSSISVSQMSLTSEFGDAQPMFTFRKISATPSNYMLRNVSSLDTPLVIKAGCSIIPLLAKLASVNELNLMRSTFHVYLTVNKATVSFFALHLPPTPSTQSNSTLLSLGPPPLSDERGDDDLSLRPTVEL